MTKDILHVFEEVTRTRTTALIEDFPELFIPLASYETKYLDPAELRAVVQAADSAARYYRKIRGPFTVE